MLNLEIIGLESKMFQGEVDGVQLPGIDGSFEILTKHAPLVSSLKKGNIVIIKNIKENIKESISINNGFVEVLNNKVSVIVG